MSNITAEVEDIVVGGADNEGANADIRPDGVEIKAERYDFAFATCLYKHQIHMDEYGERLISGTNEMGRIVAGDHIIVSGVYIEEEEEVYVNGKLML